jgi:hypothetical protein
VIRHPSRAAMIIACLAGMLTVAACSSPGSSTQPGTTATTTATPSATSTFNWTGDQQIASLFLTCLAHHSVQIYLSSLGYENVAQVGSAAGWYKNGEVIQNVKLSQWLQGYSGMYPISADLKPTQTIGGWILAAQEHGTWPTKLCGALNTSK